MSRWKRKQTAVDRCVDAFQTLVKILRRHPTSAEVASYLGISRNGVHEHLAEARREGRIPQYVRRAPRKDQPYIQRERDRRLDEYIDMRLRPTVEELDAFLESCRLPQEHLSRKHLRMALDDLKAELVRKVAARKEYLQRKPEGERDES